MKVSFVLVFVTLISAAPMVYADNAESEAKKTAIAGYIAKGDNAKATEELEGILSSTKYEDLKEWAQLELFNSAQAKGQLAKVTADLEKAASKNPNDVLLRRAVAEGYLRERNFA